MSIDLRTIQTYDNSAEQLATHFEQYKYGIARDEIDKAFSLVTKPVTYVIEIGCGAGKDAAEIVMRTKHYIGFDPSAKLLEIARTNVPNGTFVQTDALSYEYPSNVDIIFAFASLLHLDKDDFAAVCRKAASALKPGGVLSMTLKEGDAYAKLLQEDEFGTRLFYVYNPALVKELVGSLFSLVYESHTTAGPQAKKWMSLIFIKNNFSGDST
jgi:SAM-dependent methyltransferase